MTTPSPPSQPEKLKWSAIPDLRSTMSYLPLPFSQEDYKRREITFPSPYITPRLTYLSSAADSAHPPPFSSSKKPPYIYSGKDLIKLNHFENPIFIFGQPFTGKTCIFLKLIEQVNSVYGQKHWLRMIDLRTAALKYLVTGRRPANFYELVADQLHVSERSIRDTFKPVRNAKEFMRKRRYDKLVKGELILDGFDEIPELMRECFLKLIPQMKQGRQECSIRIWIGCRTYLKGQVLNLMGDDSALEILDYDVNMQKSLLFCRWKNRLFPKNMKKHEEDRLWEYTHILYNDLCKELKNFETTIGTVPFYLEVIASIFNNHAANFMQLYYKALKDGDTGCTSATANGREMEKKGDSTTTITKKETLPGKNKKKRKKSNNEKRSPRPMAPPPKRTQNEVKVNSGQLLCQISGICVVEFLEYLIFTAIDIYCLKYHYKRGLPDDEYKRILEREYRRATRLYAEYAIVTFNSGYEYQILHTDTAEDGSLKYVPNLQYIVDEDLHHIGFLVLGDNEVVVQMKNKLLGDFFLAKQFACPDNTKKSSALFDNFFVRDLLVDIDARYIRGFLDNILHFSVKEFRSNILREFLIQQYKLCPGQDEEWEQIRNQGSIWHMAVMEGFHQTAITMIKSFDPTEHEHIRKLLRIRVPMEIYEATRANCAVCQVPGGYTKGRHLISAMSLVAMFSYSDAMGDLLKIFLQYFTIEEIREEFIVDQSWTPMHYASMHSNLWFFMHIYNDLLVEIQPPPGICTPMGQLPTHLLMSYCWYHIMIFNDRFIQPYDSLPGCVFTTPKNSSLSPETERIASGSNCTINAPPVGCCDDELGRARDIISFKYMMKELQGPGNMLRLTHHECIRLMVQVGGEDINAGELVSGNTMLHYAATCGNLETVKYILEQGADVDVKNNQGKTPLHMAGLQGHREIFMCLVKHGAKATMRDEMGNSAIALWTQSGEALDKARRTTEPSKEDLHFFKACADIDRIIQEQFSRLTINAEPGTAEENEEHDENDDEEEPFEEVHDGNGEEKSYEIIHETGELPELSPDEDSEYSSDSSNDDKQEEDKDDAVLVSNESGDDDDEEDEPEFEEL